MAEEPTSNNSNTITITTSMDSEEYFFVLHEAQLRNPGPHYNRGAQIILTQNTKPESKKIAIYELRNVLIQSISVKYLKAGASEVDLLTVKLHYESLKLVSS